MMPPCLRRRHLFLAAALLLLAAPFNAGGEQEGEEGVVRPEEFPLRSPPSSAAGQEGHDEADPTAADAAAALPAAYDSGIDVSQLSSSVSVSCRKDLLPGQFRCYDPIVDPETQQPQGCHKVDEDRAVAPNSIPCEALPGLLCLETGTANFTLDSDCLWTNGYDFEMAVILSVFLGCFGADRFYLGYPALGLLKFSTLGFFFLGHLLDIILIASQTVKPADGSNYVISYFGPGVAVVSIDNDTARRPEADWYT